MKFVLYGDKSQPVTIDTIDVPTLADAVRTWRAMLADDARNNRPFPADRPTDSNPLWIEFEDELGQTHKGALWNAETYIGGRAASSERTASGWVAYVREHDGPEVPLGSFPTQRLADWMCKRWRDGRIPPFTPEEINEALRARSGAAT